MTFVNLQPGGIVLTPTEPGKYQIRQTCEIHRSVCNGNEEESASRERRLGAIAPSPQEELAPSVTENAYNR
ncbi:MAG: hypothetical protein KDA52_17930 [Planctomycetaceae bacterium]|nr:hypothetical protein [Planctomycetaceae bacterium]